MLVLDYNAVDSLAAKASRSLAAVNKQRQFLIAVHEQKLLFAGIQAWALVQARRA